jgi:hypothetical protein
MRSFYGVDRMDNAYFISENFSEALIEKDFMFTQSAGASLPGLELLEGHRKVIKPLANPTTASSSSRPT